MKTAFLLAFIVAIVGNASAFFPSAKPNRAAVTKSSPETAEAVDIFLTKFPPGRPLPKTSRLGVPDAIKTKYDGQTERKRLTDIPEDKLKVNFNALAKVYGPEQALEMVKILPIVLSFNSNWFQPSFDEYAEIFGAEEAKAMVLRNPGLLGVKPGDAATSTDQTMVFSYLVGYTRPVAPILQPLLLFALLSPAIEATTGIPVRTSFLSLFQ